MRIFERPTTSVVDEEGTAVVTLTSTDFKEVVQGTAPIRHIEIEQRVDYSITKGLSLDFFVSSFGDSPVTITIRGLSLLATCKDGSNSNKEQMMSFYNTHKLSANNSDDKKRIQLGISSTGGKPQSFMCVLIGMTTSTHTGAEQAVHDSYNYTLTLVGVPLQ